MTDADRPPSDPGAAADADADAVARVLAGDPEAFGVLVARYGRRLHDLARRMLRDAAEAEDVVQHAFLNAYRALARFDARRPFRHWLLRITTNLCRNRIASRRVHPRAVGEDPDDPGAERAAPEASPSPGGLDPLETTRVREAVERLPDAYRLAVVLRYAHGLSVEDVAEVTGEPVATVKTHLHRARAALRRSLSPPADRDLGAETRGPGAGTT
jgi:RNA polymerase sigma-70 factor (ECF subfamily)